MSGDNSYAKIPVCAVRPLVGENLADFSLYLSGKDNADPVLYRPAGSDLSLPDLERLRENGVASVCVKSEDLARCEGILESKLAEVVRRDDISVDEKAGLVFHVGTMVAREMTNASTVPDDLPRADNVVQNIITAVLSDAHVASHLLRVSEHEATTASHMFAVSAFSIILGARVVGADREHLRQLGLAGMMHDVGKLAIDKAVLSKREPLCGDEARMIQQHPIESVRMLGDDPAATRLVRQTILQHHERLDGRGYPVGLGGSDLLTESRVLTIVDSFHALIGRRAYREPLPPNKANEILMRQSQRQFDPDVLRLWTELFVNYGQSPPAAFMGLDEPTEGHPHSDHNAMRVADRALANRQQRHRCKRKLVAPYVYVGRLGHLDARPGLQSAPVEDLSRNGIGLVVNHPLYRGEVLNIRLPAAQSGSIWVRGTVSWCLRVASDSFRIGVRFVSRIPAGIILKDVPVASSFNLLEAAVDLQSVLDARAMTTETAAPPPAAEAQPTPSTVEAQTTPTDVAVEHRLAVLERVRGAREISAKDAKTIIEVSRMPEAAIRRMSVDAVVRIHSPAARSALAALLRDTDATVREHAVGVVVAQRLDDMLYALKPLLSDPIPAVALNAAAALARNGDAEAMKIIVRALDSELPQARKAASFFGCAVNQRFPANAEGVKAAKRYAEARGLVTVA